MSRIEQDIDLLLSTVCQYCAGVGQVTTSVQKIYPDGPRRITSVMFCKECDGIGYPDENE